MDITLDINELVSYIWGKTNVFVVILLALLTLAIFKPEAFQWIRQLGLSVLGFISSSARKHQEKQSIKSTLNPIIRSLRDESGIAGYSDLPDVDIRFTQDDDSWEGVHENGAITVFMRDSRKYQPENLVKATLGYVNAGMYGSARPYMSDEANKALDYTLARSLIEQKQDALAYLSRHIINKQCRENETLRNLYTSFEATYGAGLLHGLLLHQLTLLSERKPELIFDPEVTCECKEFIDYVASVARRERGEYIRLAFDRSHIKVGMFLLGRDETLERGIMPYIDHLKQYVLAEYHGCYALASGRKIDTIMEFAKAIESHGYYGPRVKAKNVEVRRVKTVGSNKRDVAVAYFEINRFAQSNN